MALVNNPVMGINLRQNKNSKNAGYGKYYPEVDMQKTLTIRGFAQHLIDHGSKYKRGDIENMLSQRGGKSHPHPIHPQPVEAGQPGRSGLQGPVFPGVA